MSYLRLLPLLLGISLLACGDDQPGAPPEPPREQPRTNGIESADYVWNVASRATAEVLGVSGNIVEGERLYVERCLACHLASGSGLKDGTYPQLAGQHKSVIVKQIMDVIEGRRDNAIMYMYSKALVDKQKLADIALYISFLKIRRNNGKGPGANLERGKELYDRDCVNCHGAQGEGIPEKFYPVLAGQHYEYLLRQIHHIADGMRRNADPEMVLVVHNYSDGDRAAISDYMSRLEWPERHEAP
jgi:cytochrome c553